MENTKKCACCLIVKDKSEFTKYRSNKDGLFSYCRPCKSIKAKEYKEEKQEKRQRNLLHLRKRNNKATLIKLLHLSN